MSFHVNLGGGECEPRWALVVPKRSFLIALDPLPEVPISSTGVSINQGSQYRAQCYYPCYGGSQRGGAKFLEKSMRWQLRPLHAAVQLGAGRLGQLQQRGCCRVFTWLSYGSTLAALRANSGPLMGSESIYLIGIMIGYAVLAVFWMSVGTSFLLMFYSPCKLERQSSSPRTGDLGLKGPLTDPHLGPNTWNWKTWWHALLQPRGPRYLIGKEQGPKISEWI